MSWSLRDACASVFSSEKYDVGRWVAGAGTARPPPGGTARGTTQRRPVRFEPSVFVRVARTLTERRLGEAPTNRPRIEGDVAFAGQPRVARVTVAPRAHRAEEVITLGLACVGLGMFSLYACLEVAAAQHFRRPTPAALLAVWIAAEVRDARRGRAFVHLSSLAAACTLMRTSLEACWDHLGLFGSLT